MAFIAFRDPTDPFGDGSLVESWTFTDPITGDFINDCQQTTSNPWVHLDGASIVANLDDIRNYNGMSWVDLDGWTASTTNTQQLVGYVDATFCAWIRMSDNGSYFYGNSKISFGQTGQRYNVEFDIRDDSNDTGINAIIRLHKEATIVTVGSNLTNGYYHFAVTVDATAGTLDLYFQGLYVTTVTLAMKFDSSKKIQHFHYSNSTSYARATDIQYYNRVLSALELEQVMNDTFPVPVEIIDTPATLEITNLKSYGQPESHIMFGPIEQLSITQNKAIVPKRLTTRLDPFFDHPNAVVDKWAGPDYTPDTKSYFSPNLQLDPLATAAVRPYLGGFWYNDVIALRGFVSAAEAKIPRTATSPEDFRFSGSTSFTIHFSGYQNYWSFDGTYYGAQFKTVFGGANGVSLDHNNSIGPSSADKNIDLIVIVGGEEVFTYNTIESFYIHAALVVSFNAVTNECKVYLNNVLQTTTIVTTLNFAPADKVVTTWTYVCDCSKLEIMDFCMDATEISDYTHYSYSTETSLLAYSRADCTFLDPFEDGSLISSYSFENTTNNDQGTASIALDRYSILELPASNYGAKLIMGYTEEIDPYIANCTISFVLYRESMFKLSANQTDPNSIRATWYPSSKTFQYSHLGSMTTQMLSTTLPDSGDSIWVAVIRDQGNARTDVWVDQVLVFTIDEAPHAFTQPAQIQAYLTTYAPTWVDELFFFSRPLDITEVKWVTGGCIGPAPVVIVGDIIMEYIYSKIDFIGKTHNVEYNNYIFLEKLQQVLYAKLKVFSSDNSKTNKLEFNIWGFLSKIMSLSYNIYALIPPIIQMAFSYVKHSYLDGPTANIKYSTKMNYTYSLIKLFEYYKVLELKSNKYYYFINSKYNLIFDKVKDFIESSISLKANNYESPDTVLEINYGIGSNNHKAIELIYKTIKRAYIVQSFETEVPVLPSYLDGALQFWEPQQLDYLGDCTGTKGVEKFKNTFTVTPVINYVFEDIPNKDILTTGPLNLDDIALDRDEEYQQFGNVAIIKAVDNYFCYVIQGSSSFGDILYKPAPLSLGVESEHNPEINFVKAFPTNREFNVLSTIDANVISYENQPGNWPNYYSNALPGFNFIVETGGSTLVNPNDLVLASTVFTIVQGGINVYFHPITGFYYYPNGILPTEPFTANPEVSLNEGINGNITKDIVLVALSYTPDEWILNGLPIEITATTIIYHPSALINRVLPVLIKTYEDAYVIPTTIDITQITLERSEYKLSGYIIVSGVDKWATLTWKSLNTYTINSLSTITDLSKLATKELVVNKSFNKYL